MRLLPRTWRLAGIMAVAAGAALLYGCSDKPTPTQGVGPQFGTPGVDALNRDLRPTTKYPASPGSPQDWGYPTAAQWVFPVPFNVGTGRIDPFLTIQNDPREYGFNTDGDWDKKLYDMTRPQYVDAIKVSDIPTIVVGDVLMKEIIFDANESNSDLDAAQFAINTFNLWACDNAAAATYTEPSQIYANCDLIYYVNHGDKVDRAMASDAETKGSGNALDYVINFPASIFPDADDGCTYAPTGSSCGVYIIAELDLGDETNVLWETGATFEELALVKRPKLTIDKTADVTFRRTYKWIVDKKADPALHNLVPGETSPVTTYTITADLDPDNPYEDDNFVVSGVITVSNPSTDDWKEAAVVNDIWDVLPDGTKLEFADLTCTDTHGAITLPYTIEPGAEINCAYESEPLTGLESTDVNTAYVNYSDPEDDATVLPDEKVEKTLDFATDPSEVVNATVNVYDDYQGSDDPDESPVLLGQASVDDPPPTSFTRTRTWTFTPDLTQCGAFDNQATIYYVNGDVQEALPADEAEAEVVVNCAHLTVTKTVNTWVHRTWNWTLSKSADPTLWKLFAGESATSDYTVSVDKVDYTEDGWKAYGVITVTNDGKVTATVTSVTDVLSNSGTFDATVSNCSPALPATLASGNVMTCDYTTGEGGLTSGDYTSNVATANLDGGGKYVSDAYTVDFTSPGEIAYKDASVTVYDNFDGGGDVKLFDATDDYTQPTYSHTFTCGDSHTYDNTASMYGADSGLLDQKDASVEVLCYGLSVTKDVLARYDRNWTWEVEKDFTDAFITGTDNLECTEPDANGDRTCTVSIVNDANVTVQYQVMVTANGTDYNYQVLNGPNGIVITNSHPDRDAELTEVTDVVSTMGAATVTCSSYVVPAGGTLKCTYTTGMVADNPGGGTNKATAVQQLYDFASDLSATADGTKSYDSGDVPFSFVMNNETNECANTVDVLAGYTDEDFGQVCATTFPTQSWTFDAYERVVGPDECGKTLINTATVTPNDGGPPDDDSETLIVQCVGCTLTQGFYKTHSEYGKAPYSSLWETPFTPNKGDTPFFATGYSWYQMFWLAPSGGNRYIQLAHQWMAAKLNEYWNGGAPAAVETALTQGEALLIAYQGAVDIDQKTDDGKTAQSLAALLDSYNSGKLGVPHCTENTLPFLISVYGSMGG